MQSILNGIKANKLLCIIAIINFSLYSYLSGLTVINILNGFVLTLTFILLGIANIFSLMVLELYIILASVGLYESLKSYTDMMTNLKIVLPSFAILSIIILISAYIWHKNSMHYIIKIQKSLSKVFSITFFVIYILAILLAYFYYPKSNFLLTLKSSSDILTIVGIALGYLLLILRYKEGWQHLSLSFFAVFISNLTYNLAYQATFDPVLFISIFLNFVICILSFRSWHKVQKVNLLK